LPAGVQTRPWSGGRQDGGRSSSNSDSSWKQLKRVVKKLDAGKPIGTGIPPAFSTQNTRTWRGFEASRRAPPLTPVYIRAGFRRATSSCHRRGGADDPFLAALPFGFLFVMRRSKFLPNSALHFGNEHSRQNSRYGQLSSEYLGKKKAATRAAGRVHRRPAGAGVIGDTQIGEQSSILVRHRACAAISTGSSSAITRNIQDNSVCHVADDHACAGGQLCDRGTTARFLHGARCHDEVLIGNGGRC